MAAYAETVVTDIPAIRLTGLVISVDGSNAIKVTERHDPLQLGQALAQKAIAQGADEILALSKVK